MGGDVFFLGEDALLLVVLEDEAALDEEVLDLLVGAALVGEGVVVSWCASGGGGLGSGVAREIKELDVLWLDVEGADGYHGTDGDDDAAAVVAFLVLEDAFHTVEDASDDADAVAGLQLLAGGEEVFYLAVHGEDGVAEAAQFVVGYGDEAGAADAWVEEADVGGEGGVVLQLHDVFFGGFEKDEVPCEELPFCDGSACGLHFFHLDGHKKVVQEVVLWLFFDAL